MKNILLIITSLLLLMLFPGCEIVGGIFKAGVWTGVVFVILIIVLIIYLLRRMNKKE